MRPPSIVVGNAAAGEAYFKSRCALVPFRRPATCKGIATRYGNPRTLQQSWLMPGSAAGRGRSAAGQREATACDGDSAGAEKVEGEIERLDDFSVAIRLDDGTRRVLAHRQRESARRGHGSAAGASRPAEGLQGRGHPQCDCLSGDAEMMALVNARPPSPQRRRKQDCSPSLRSCMASADRSSASRRASTRRRS